MEQRIESTKFIAKWTVTYASMFTRAAVGKLLYNPDTNKDIANDNESEKDRLELLNDRDSEQYRKLRRE